MHKSARELTQPERCTWFAILTLKVNNSVTAYIQIETLSLTYSTYMRSRHSLENIFILPIWTTLFKMRSHRRALACWQVTCGSSSRAWFGSLRPSESSAIVWAECFVIRAAFLVCKRNQNLETRRKMCCEEKELLPSYYLVLCRCLMWDMRRGRWEMVFAHKV